MRPVEDGFYYALLRKRLISRLLLAWALCGLGVVWWLPEGAALSALSVARRRVLESARLDFTLSPVVEDACNWGIRIAFVVETECCECWYGRPRPGYDTRRYTRLMYQPDAPLAPQHFVRTAEQRGPGRQSDAELRRRTGP